MKALTLILLTAGMLATIVVLFEAARRRRNLIRSGRNGTMLMVANFAVRREGMRTLKHSLLVYAVATAFLPQLLPPGFSGVSVRLAIVAIVAALMGVTSLWERRYRCRLEKKLEEDEAKRGRERMSGVTRPPYPPGFTA